MSLLDDADLQEYDYDIQADDLDIEDSVEIEDEEDYHEEHDEYDSTDGSLGLFSYLTEEVSLDDDESTVETIHTETDALDTVHQEHTDEPDELSTEFVGLSHKMNSAAAFEKQAINASRSNDVNKMSDSELEEEHDLEEEKSQNRKEALKDLGKKLIKMAKGEDKDVKDIAYIAYNLASGKRIKREKSEDEE